MVLYSVSFQIENDSMATPMKAAAAAKDQLISKCIFGVFNSPKKQTKTIQLEVSSRMLSKASTKGCRHERGRRKKRFFSKEQL